MRDRIEKGPCYYCEAKWNLRYECQKPILYLIEEINDTLVEEMPLEGEENQKIMEALIDLGNLKENPETSLHAIIGSVNLKTMRENVRIGACWMWSYKRKKHTKFP